MARAALRPWGVNPIGRDMHQAPVFTDGEGAMVAVTPQSDCRPANTIKRPDRQAMFRLSMPVPGPMARPTHGIVTRSGRVLNRPGIAPEGRVEFGFCVAAPGKSHGNESFAAGVGDWRWLRGLIGCASRRAEWFGGFHKTFWRRS